MSVAAALNWYRANVRLDQFGDTQPRPAPLIMCPVLGVWSTGDFGVLEAQMKGSERYGYSMLLVPLKHASIVSCTVVCDAVYPQQQIHFLHWHHSIDNRAAVRAPPLHKPDIILSHV